MAKFSYNSELFNFSTNHTCSMSEPDNVYKPAKWFLEQVLERRTKAKQGMYPHYLDKTQWNRTEGL
jgi:hypothetical protein